MLFCEPFANVLRNLLFCVAKLTVLPPETYCFHIENNRFCRAAGKSLESNALRMALQGSHSL